jgi:glycosyltransferase involved in cell wall biosynthesis
MRILHTTEFYSPHRGGNLAIQAISELLAARGHEVTVATSFLPERNFSELNGVRIEQFKIQGRLTTRIKGDVERYKDFILQGDFDIVTNFFADIWTTDLMFGLLHRVRAKKVLSTPGLSKLAKPSHREYFYGSYLHALAEYDRIVYTSANYRDKVFGDSHGVGKKAVIIPNGAGREFLTEEHGFRSKYDITTPFMLLTVANHYFQKGHPFVIKAFRKLGMRDVSLVILGETPKRHPWFSCYPVCVLASTGDSRIRVLRNVPRNLVVSAFQEADLFLFGSQVECAPLVMYEAFASRTPFITTNVGNVSDHQDVVQIIKTPDEMATVASELLKDESKRTAIAERAYQLWLREHTWESIAARYESLYQSLLR